MAYLFVRCGGGDDTRRSGDRQAGMAAATTGSYEAPCRSGTPSHPPFQVGALLY